MARAQKVSAYKLTVKLGTARRDPIMKQLDGVAHVHDRRHCSTEHYLVPERGQPHPRKSRSTAWSSSRSELTAATRAPEKRSNQRS